MENVQMYLKIRTLSNMWLNKPRYPFPKMLKETKIKTEKVIGGENLYV